MTIKMKKISFFYTTMLLFLFLNLDASPQSDFTIPPKIITLDLKQKDTWVEMNTKEETFFDKFHIIQLHPLLLSYRLFSKYISATWMKKKLTNMTGQEIIKNKKIMQEIGLAIQQKGQKANAENARNYVKDKTQNRFPLVSQTEKWQLGIALGTNLASEIALPRINIMRPEIKEDLLKSIRANSLGQINSICYASPENNKSFPEALGYASLENLAFISQNFALRQASKRIFGEKTKKEESDESFLDTFSNREMLLSFATSVLIYGEKCLWTAAIKYFKKEK